MIIRNSIIPVRGFKALNLCGFIFVRRECRFTAHDLRHELIHTRQQRELLFVGFFIIYIAEWCYHLIRLRSPLRAYHAISFEREAYRHQATPTYLLQRRHYASFRTRRS